ncbi:MAG: PAS domain-containing protein, partial [Verrucomicrobia bacterium]
MPELPESLTQDPQLAARIRQAFDGNIPDAPQFQRFIELIEADLSAAREGADGAGAAAERSGGLIWRIGREGDAFILRWCRGQLLRRLGFFPDELEGKPPAALFEGATARSLELRFQQAWGGEGHVADLDLAEFGLKIHAQFQPVYEAGQVREVVMTAVEATEAARDSRFIERVLHNTAEGVVVTDADTAAGPRIVFANRAFTEISGLEESEVQGRPFSEFFVARKTSRGRDP